MGVAPFSYCHTVNTATGESCFPSELICLWSVGEWNGKGAKGDFNQKGCDEY